MVPGWRNEQRSFAPNCWCPDRCKRTKIKHRNMFCTMSVGVPTAHISVDVLTAQKRRCEATSAVLMDKSSNT